MPTKKSMSVLAVVAICLILAVSIQADNLGDKLRVPADGNRQILTLNDGSVLVGKITDIGSSKVTFKSEVGEVVIDIDKIRDIEEVADTSFKDGKYWFPNPNRTRLYFASTGRMLKGGEGYLSDIYIFFPGFAFGLTDNITIGGGMSIFPGADLNEQLFYLTPKIGLKANKFADLAVGALIVRIPNYVEDDGFSGLEDDSYTIGVLDIIGTFGSADRSFTAGLGYGIADGKMADKPAVILGGEYRLARRLSFVTENWILPEINVPIISYGVRFFGETLSADLAFFNVIDEDAVFPGIPYIDFVWNF